MPTWFPFVLALVLIVATSAAVSRGRGDDGARLLRVVGWAVGALVGAYAFTDSDQRWLAAGGHLLVMHPMHCAASLTAWLIRSNRQHLREMQQPPVPVDGGPELHRSIEDARALGCELLPDGIVGGHTSHGDAAALIDAHGRLMNIVDNASAVLVGLITRTQDDELLSTQNVPIDPVAAEAFRAHRVVADATLSELVEAHAQLEAAAWARGDVPAPFSVETVGQEGDEVAERLTRHWLRRPWWNGARSVWAAFGLRTLFVLPCPPTRPTGTQRTGD